MSTQENIMQDATRRKGRSLGTLTMPHGPEIAGPNTIPQLETTMARVTAIRRDDGTPDPEHRVGVGHGVSTSPHVGLGLVLEMEFLTGQYWGSRRPGDTYPDWPPQVDRVFSALVCAWGVRGQRNEERAALEWLERQPPPAIHASGHESSRRPITSVRNDGLPHKPPRIVRWVPIAIPHEDLMAMVWDDCELPPAVFEALNALASCVPRVGSSPSLVRCSFLRKAKAAHMRLPQQTPRRRIYPGRLRELERDFRANQR